MPRPSKINNEKLLEDLKAGMNNYQAARKHSVSGERVRQKRIYFESLPPDHRFHLPPRAELVTMKRTRGLKKTIKPQKPLANKPRPDYQEDGRIRQIVREEMRAFFSAIAGIDELTRERDILKEQLHIAQKTLSKITQSQREYELALQQNQIQAPLTSKRTSDFTYHIDCASELIVPDTSPLLTISAGSFVFN